MTVSTVVAGLLPIMWSNRVGAEVMKPLATPVLGGMVSSLLYVLIVTPVLFYWIHERRLRRRRSAAGCRQRSAADPQCSLPSRRRGARAVGGGPRVVSSLIVALAGTRLVDLRRARRSRTRQPARCSRPCAPTIWSITLSNADGALRQGSNASGSSSVRQQTNELVDVGTVQLGAAMTMPGMVMTSPITIAPAGQPGVYDATGEFSMAGSWQMTLEWNGPAGRGSAAFDGDVQ